MHTSPAVGQENSAQVSSTHVAPAPPAGGTHFWLRVQLRSVHSFGTQLAAVVTTHFWSAAQTTPSHDGVGCGIVETQPAPVQRAGLRL
jgi:hypothetical protein